jgi:excisionase family DNA binding protein
MEVQDRPLLSVKQAAQRLGCSEKTIRRRLAEGSLPAVKLGSNRQAVIRIDPRDIDPRERDGWLARNSITEGRFNE